VNVFLWAATALLALEIVLLGFAFVAARLDALVALQAAGGIWLVALVLLAQGFHRPSYMGLAVVAVVVSYGGAMVFVRFFERELGP
jgi:multisubunit Na+/H+ antiporter MnhF subunit